ncbi:MAG: cysteine desulfurase [Clostridia bacterium]|nr:cysteine desulfurase [Clostridia bacterium]
MADIYFDNSATTKISQGARDKMNEVMDKLYGNPSSLHKLGVEAERVVSEARSRILTSLGITRGVRGELVFTSGGTEANNLAILGSVFAKKRNGSEKILTTQGEHASVENTLNHLEKSGFKVVRVPTKNGEIDLDFIKENGRDAIVATFMHVNNETGALYDIAGAFEAVRSVAPGVVCHADCVQSYMKVKLSKKSIGADLITLSAHKINGAKGTGALYIAPEILKAKKISPILFGGGQEENIRSGTENVYGISAFGQASYEHYSKLSEEIENMRELRGYIVGLVSKVVGAKVNEPVNSAPHIISLTVKGIRSETMLHFLSSKGIYVSSGSACSSHSVSGSSQALLSFGLSVSEADSTIRISLCPENTRDEADKLYSALIEASARLARR